MHMQCPLTIQLPLWFIAKKKKKLACKGFAKLYKGFANLH